MKSPHRGIGIALIVTSTIVFLASFADVVLYHFTTSIALLMPLALLGIIEGVAIMKHDNDTISENTWDVRLLWQDMQWKQRLMVVILCLLNFLGGHLFWQSDRTYRDLRCERSGGYMLCITPPPGTMTEVSHGK